MKLYIIYYGRGGEENDVWWGVADSEENAIKEFLEEVELEESDFDTMDVYAVTAWGEYVIKVEAK